MSFRASILALASIATLAVTALAPTGASALADGSVRFNRFADHAHYGFLARVKHCRLDPYKS
jgi:hypothetical protein